jgi:hypothetical protein
MTLRSSAIRRILPLAGALALAACGATPPEAPLKQAARLDSATSGISTACGLTYQVTAFPGDHAADLETLEATASSSAQKLASVYAKNPAWMYQGETVGEIVRDALSMLDTCGLTQAEHTLRRATSAHRDAGAGT